MCVGGLCRVVFLVGWLVGMCIVSDESGTALQSPLRIWKAQQNRTTSCVTIPMIRFAGCGACGLRHGWDVQRVKVRGGGFFGLAFTV
jgi:hypothetical protein